MERFVIAGPPRSGSTLVWQIARAMIPGESIVRTHPEAWKRKEGQFTIVTVRDPRDVAASRWRIRGRTQDISKFGIAVLRQEITVMIPHFTHIERVLNSPSVLLKYEDFWDDHDVVIDALSEPLNAAVSEETRAVWRDDFGIDANRRRSEVKNNSHTWDPAYQIHALHVANPAPGEWKTVIPEWGWEEVEKRCAALVKQWGYE